MGLEKDYGLIVGIVKTFRFPKKYLNDALSVGRMGYIKALSTFNPDKGTKFSTYAYTVIRNAVSTFVKNIDDSTCIGDIIESVADSDKFTEIDNRIVLEQAITKLSKREAEIIRKYFYEERTLDSIAKDYSISKERVRQIKFEALSKLREELKIE